MAYASHDSSLRSNRTWQQLTVTLVLVTALLTIGCKRKPEKPATPVTPNDVTVTIPVPSVIARIGGQEITADQVDTLVAARMEDLKAKRTDQPAAALSQREQEITREVVEVLVVTALLEEQVKLKGITVTDEEVKTRITEIGADREPAVSVEALLSEQGDNAEAYQTNIRRDLAFQKLFAPLYEGEISVSDAEIKAYYKAQLRRFNHPKQVRASHIQIPTTDRASAEALLEKLKSGEDFATLAQTHSKDSLSAPQGGDLGFFDQQAMEKPFADAAFALQPGQLSNIVETTLGLHIIKVTEVRNAHTQTLEEATDSIRDSLTLGKKKEIQRQYIQSLRQAADVRYKLPQSIE